MTTVYQKVCRPGWPGARIANTIEWYIYRNFLGRRDE